MMRKKKKIFFLSLYMIISSLFLTSDTLMAARHLLTRVQSNTTKVNIAKNRARYKYDLGAQELTPTLTCTCIVVSTLPLFLKPSFHMIAHDRRVVVTTEA